MQVQGFRNTAVLLFTRDVIEEAGAKILSPSRSGNLLIAKKLISHSQKIIRQTGLPWIIIDSSRQRGNNFGERFTNAIEQVFEFGFENVIAIGNDCPGLTKKTLLEASQKLQTNDTVFGPASDGGIYLFGIKRSLFYKDVLLTAPWNSKNLFEYLTAFLRNRSIRFFTTEKLGDIDSEKDLQHAIHIFQNKLIAFVANIKSIVASLQPGRTNISHLSLFAGSGWTAGLRAPPVQ